MRCALEVHLARCLGKHRVNRLYGLDALRGIAALVVALHHSAAIFGLAVPPFHPGLAVDLFFILSGFVMTRTYEDRIRSGLSTASFLDIRYRRLFMPLAIGSTIGLGWAATELGPSPELLVAWVLILAFLPTTGMDHCFLLNGPAWSLFVEITANGIHSSCFARLSDQVLVGVWAVLTGIAVAMLFAGISHWAPGIGGIISLIPRELSCYVAGILVFRRFGDAPLGNKPLLAITFFCLALVVATFNIYLEIAATFIAAPLIIRGSIGLRRMTWAVWAGSLSYPLYAVHVPTMKLAKLWGLHALGSFALAVAAAIVVTVLFEVRQKAQRMGSRANA